jgi:transcriptional activator SPT8
LLCSMGGGSGGTNGGSAGAGAGHRDAVSQLRLLNNNDERGLVSGGWDAQLLLWDLNSGVVSYDLTSSSAVPQYHSAITSADVSPVDQHLVMGASYDGRIVLWDTRRHGHVAVLTADQILSPWCLSAQWSADGRRVYAGRRNECFEEFDVRTIGRPSRLYPLPSLSGSVSCVKPLPNNNRQILCASNDSIRLYDLYPDPGRVVPFSVVAGHHGGVVSNLLWLENAAARPNRFLISTSGNRGLLGLPENHHCLAYEVA